MYQSTGIEKEDDSRQTLENHGKVDEIRRLHNKKFEEGHDVHRNLALAEGYPRPNKKGEYQNVSGVMGIAYNPFLNSEAASAYRNHEVAELLKYWTEKIIVIDPMEREKPTSKLGSVKKLEPGSCLDLNCGGGGHTCDGGSCVRIESLQGEDLVTWFGDITEREKSEVQIMAECYTSTTVNIATALGFFSKMCSLQSLEMLESEHHLVTALSVESWPGALQTTQKHIRGRKIGLEAEMGFSVSEAYGLPVNAKSLVGSVMANVCGSHYPLHMAMVEVSSQRILVDKAFSLPKCVRLARMSHHSHRLLRKILRTVPRAQRDDLSEIWGEELLSLGDENRSNFETHNAIGKPMGNVPAPEEDDVVHEKMMELEHLLEASGERNLRSIKITHGECPCHCLAQTVWYPEHTNLCLVWDVEEIRSIVLPDHQQKVTILVVSTMLALRWIEENVTKYRESKTPTAESIHAID